MDIARGWLVGVTIVFCRNIAASLMLCERPLDPFCNKVAAAITSAVVDGGIEGRVFGGFMELKLMFVAP